MGEVAEAVEVDAMTRTDVVPTDVIAGAMRTLSETVDSDDGVASGAIYQAAVQQLKENAKNSAAAYQILVIPLYFESTRYQKIADTVLVIDCPEALQIERAMQRNGSTAASVQAVMQAQVSRARRLEGADEVIDNQGNLAALQEKVGQLHKKFIKTCIVNK